MVLPDKSILVVDDDEATRKLLHAYLQQYRVIQACDGEEGLEKFHLHQPDVVITDIKMPKIDGLSLLREIKKSAPLTPVIILSGAGSMQDVIDALRLEASDYLEKPIRKQEIVLHIVENAFKIKRLENLRLHYQTTLESEILRKTGQLQEQLSARQQTERELLHAQGEWQRTFDAIPDNIAILDNDLSIIRANRAMKSLLEKKRGGSDGGFLSSRMQERKIENPFSLELQLVNDGNIHTLELFDETLRQYFVETVVPFYGDDGITLDGYVLIARDIDNRIMLEAEREKMQVKLLHTQKLESVGQLAAGIAHEINTPI